MSVRPKCDVCGGPQSLEGSTLECPECDWHECDSPAIWHAEKLTCPECGHEW